MIPLFPQWLKNTLLSSHVAKLLLISFGFAASAFGQLEEPELPYIPVTYTAELWREWMSDSNTFGRENSQISSARLYLMTDREILQTSATTAKFQNGRYRMVLADGSVPDVDADLDYYTDDFERDNEYANPDDYREWCKVNVNGALVSLPDDAFQILLANGETIGIPERLFTTQASLVKAKSGANVRVISAPASDFKRPVSFDDYSGSFYYYFIAQGQTVGEYRQFSLPLYHMQKEFPNPGDCSALEKSLVPGVYQVEFPTIPNQPNGKAVAQVNHRLVPNGALTIGLKKPTWLVNKLESAESVSKPPVLKPWVNGKIKFDPYLVTKISWDNLIQKSLASVNDYIDIWLEDEDDMRISYSYRLRADKDTLTFDSSAEMKYLYGDFPSFLGNTGGPLTINGSIVMKYSRYSNVQATADLSTVTVRVPAEMAVSYFSWKKYWFSSNPDNESIAGPSADPDKDGLTNQQEFDQASNPTKPAISVVNPTSTELTAKSATLGGEVIYDDQAAIFPQIFENGVVYSYTNSNPTLDALGVYRELAKLLPELTPPPDIYADPPELPYDGTFSTNVTGLNANTSYYFRAYVVTDRGTYYSTPTSSFKTLTLPPVSLPTVTAPTSTNITGVSAVLGGDVISDGNSTITERGVVFSPTSLDDNPFYGDAQVTAVSDFFGGTGVFTLTAYGLTPGVSYSYRAYAKNAVGISHSSTIGTFKAASAPTVIAATDTAITATTVVLGGNITGHGGMPITQRGVVYSLESANSNPILGGNQVKYLTSYPAEVGIFTVNVRGLQPGQKYAYKAYATNGVDTTYTTPAMTFTTAGALATITSPTLKNVTATGATLGANVTSNGNLIITERGFIYSKTSVNNNPLLGGLGVTKLQETPLGVTPGLLTKDVTGLDPNTGYTFKAYAINAAGEAYCESQAFLTTFPPLTVHSPTVADVTATTATLGGTVDSDGGTSADERGVVYSTDPSVAPVIDGPGVVKVVASGTVGVFTVPVTELTAEQTYYFRAYAKNGGGAGYSEVSTFITNPVLLLGLAQVQFQPSQAPAAYSIAGASAAAPTGLRFTYQKTPSDIKDGLTFDIELSEDFKNWNPINRTLWLVQETPSTISADWNSTTASPPKRSFFRVVGTTKGVSSK